MSRGAEGDAAGSPPRALTTRAAGALAGLSLLAALALAGRLWSLHVTATGDAAGLFHDGGVYLVTARALADGAGYRAIGTPDAPPAVRYPPLYPLALSAVWRVAPRFPDNLPLLKGVGLAAAFGLAAVLPGALMAAGVPPPVAVATAVLTAAAPLTLRYATAIASEVPFTALAFVALGLTQRRGRRWAAAAGAVAGLAFLTRSVGLAVIAAGVLTLLPRDRREAMAFVLAAAPCVAGWLVWLLAQHDAAGTPGYLAALAHDGIPGPSQVLAHLVAVPAAVAIVAIPGAAELLPTSVPLPLAVVAYAVGAIALGGALRGRYAAYVALTVAVAVAVPWFQPRFLLPLAPLLVAALLTTTWRRAGRTPTLALAMLLLCLAMAGHAVALERARATGLPTLDAGSWPTGHWPDLDRALDWLRTHTHPDDVIASFDDPLVHLYTGRHTVQAYPALWNPAPTDVTAAIARGNVHWIVDIAPPSTGVWAASRAAWHEWVAAQADSLTVAYEAPGITIWRRVP